MESGFDMLAIPLLAAGGERVGWWVIELSSSSVSLNPANCEASPLLPTGWIGRKWSNDNSPPIQVISQGDGRRIRLHETRTYDWTVKGGELVDDVQIVSTLESTHQRSWKTVGNSSGTFCVVNHLGMATFELNSPGRFLRELTFEIVSRKFDFDSEYRKMTEDIADFCQQLLLNWEAPTSLSFNADPTERSKLLLEQFLFLRHFMNEERLSRLLEAIDRNPHSRLNKEMNWVPAGAARSNDFLSDPVGMLRSWHQMDGRPRPAEVLDVRKQETHDTAPNRFIKFALAAFRQLCAEVHALKWTENGKPSSVGAEALEMVEALDALLARRFFNEVGRMQRLPLDNQTLQKREGYREVLQAWLLTQAAASLNWEGEQECYSGSTRNVATLYEYWIFIKLHELLKSIDGMLSVETESEAKLESFISEKKGQLTINLKSGSASCSRFIWNGPHSALKVDLHYERTFSYNEGATHSGSYSRRFRPDYTLSIYPAAYQDESKAEKDGKVAHLHFDAKYRAEDITKLFGESELNDTDISAEKLESKSERTYKRGDLLKMHTYNDALRHTIGSYVLYPGTDTEKRAQMSKFHEIAPGVGAMVMKPGNDACIKTLKDFILDVLEHQSDSFSQYRYLTDTTYRTHTEEPKKVEEDGSTYSIARKDAPCVLLYMHKDNINTFKEHGFAYCRVDTANSDKALNLNLSVEVGSEFIPYGGSRSGTRQTLGWRAKIKSVRFMENSQLHEYIQTTHPTSGITPGQSPHYLIFEFDESTKFKKYNVAKLHKTHNSASCFMAITCSWQDVLTSAEPID
jgi:predicted component of viral defense system (DUF524 family)